MVYGVDDNRILINRTLQKKKRKHKKKFPNHEMKIIDNLSVLTRIHAWNMKINYL